MLPLYLVTPTNVVVVKGRKFEALLHEIIKSLQKTARAHF